MNTTKELFWTKEENKSAKLKIKFNFVEFLFYYLVKSINLVIRPLGVIRFGLIYSDKIGKFLGNTEYYLRKKKIDKIYKKNKKNLDILISGTPINQQILNMFKKRARIIQQDAFYKFLKQIKYKKPEDKIWIDLQMTGWMRGYEWTEPGPQVSFTKSETEKGKKILQEIGMPDGAEYICFFAKDKFYSDNPKTKPDPLSYWGQRDFRNCNIDNFLEATEYLAKKGIYSVRVGIHEPEKKLNTNNKMIIDYTGVLRSNLSDRDFADAYIAANCKFFLGCTSGIYLLASIFDVPIVHTNMIPYGECGRKNTDMFIVKKCRDKKTKKILPIKKMMDLGMTGDWFTEKQILEFEKKNIEIEENSSEEIKDLVKEMNSRIDKNWVNNNGEEYLQKRYKQITNIKCFDNTPFPGKVGYKFLKKSKELLD